MSSWDEPDPEGAITIGVFLIVMSALMCWVIFKNAYLAGLAFCAVAAIFIVAALYDRKKGGK